MSGKIKSAYRTSISFYDEVLCGRTWWSKCYLSIFWGGINDIDIANRLLQKIPENFNGKLLDVPVGTGIFTADTYAHLKDATITGIDYSSEMLEKCENLMSSRGVSIELLQGDVGALPFADEDFDILLSMNGFHVFPDKQKAYDECHRVLKQGGLFLGCFFIRNELKISDCLVKNVLTKKGWFTPPFESKETLQNRLKKRYDLLWFRVDGAIASFLCRKK